MLLLVFVLLLCAASPRAPSQSGVQKKYPPDFAWRKQSQSLCFAHFLEGSCTKRIPVVGTYSVFSRNRSPGWGRGDHHTSCGERRGVRGHSLRRRAATPILRIRKQCCTKTSFRGPADTHVYMFIKSVEYMHVCIYVYIACSCWWCCCCG